MIPLRNTASDPEISERLISYQPEIVLGDLPPMLALSIFPTFSKSQNLTALEKAAVQKSILKVGLLP
jgi:hypothetical protein